VTFYLSIYLSIYIYKDLYFKEIDLRVQNMRTNIGLLVDLIGGGGDFECSIA
jgi:hypothetical protein